MSAIPMVTANLWPICITFKSPPWGSLASPTSPFDSMATKRRVDYASMVYEQVVHGDEPSFIRTTFVNNELIINN